MLTGANLRLEFTTWLKISSVQGQLGFNCGDMIYQFSRAETPDSDSLFTLDTWHEQLLSSPSVGEPLVAYLSQSISPPTISQPRFSTESPSGPPTNTSSTFELWGFTHYQAKIAQSRVMLPTPARPQVYGKRIRASKSRSRPKPFFLPFFACKAARYNRWGNRFTAVASFCHHPVRHTLFISTITKCSIIAYCPFRLVPGNFGRLCPAPGQWADHDRAGNHHSTVPDQGLQKKAVELKVYSASHCQPLYPAPLWYYWPLFFPPRGLSFKMAKQLENVKGCVLCLCLERPSFRRSVAPLSAT